MFADISTFFKNSRNSEKLRWLWKGWRDESGAKMRKLYKRYIELKNLVAVLNGRYSSITGFFHRARKNEFFSHGTVHEKTCDAATFETARALSSSMHGVIFRLQGCW